MIQHDGGAGGVIRKIVITTVVGGLTFPVTNILVNSWKAQLGISVSVGAVILLAQLIVDFDNRLAAVEQSQMTQTNDIQRAVTAGFAKINEATRLFGRVEEIGLKTDTITELAQQVASIRPDSPPLVTAFVQAQFHRLSQNLHELGDGGEITYEGEDRDWLLSLTRTVRSTLDATSLAAVDAGGKAFDGGFWDSDLGHRYLDRQREAIARGVNIRRIFFLDRAEIESDPDFLRMCQTQMEIGIDVRVLRPSAAPVTIVTQLYDFVLFDNVLSYEVTPATRVDDSSKPVILHTRLQLRKEEVDKRIERYKDLWTSARVFVG